MPLLSDPLPRATALVLREAVVRHATTERRKRFAPLLHLGRPGTTERTVPAALADTDHAVRCDQVAAVLARLPEDQPGKEPLVWLTRPGDLAVEDLDMAWLSACATACAEAGRDLTWVVVTRHGWRDPRSGLGRTWRRIRR